MAQSGEVPNPGMSTFKKGLLSAAGIAGIGLIGYLLNSGQEQSVPPQSLEHHLNENHEIGFNDMNVVKKLGQGAFGEVYEVIVNGKHVAVKKIILTNKRERSMAVKELQALFACNHKNIVGYQTYWLSPSRDAFFIQMELCQGGTLKKWLETNNLKQRNGTQFKIWRKSRWLALFITFI